MFSWRSRGGLLAGIPFSQVPEQKKTSVLQYVFLLMFLRRKKRLGVRPLDPLERIVADKVDVGDISWLPIGRNMAFGMLFQNDGRIFTVISRTNILIDLLYDWMH